MSKSFKRSILAISAALVIFVFLGGFGLSGVRAGSQNSNDGAYREIGVYEEVLKKVQSDYVVDPHINDVTNGALHGLLESLDADSSYLSPSEYKFYKDHQSEGRRPGRDCHLQAVWVCHGGDGRSRIAGG